jgi:hypothetical protein
MNAMDPVVDAVADQRAQHAASELGLEVLGLLREGPVTRTWNAKTPDGRGVALVVLAEAASADDRERFRRTATDLKAVGEVFGGVLRVHDVASAGNAMVTDAWSSGTARDLSALRWSVAQRLEFGRRAVEGLATLHRAGFVHGALTPDAILLDDGLQPVLGELGTVSRKEPFAAPEVCRGEVPTARADVYSAGRVLLELLEGETIPGLTEVVEKATSQLTLVRYASAVEMAKAIQDAIRGVSLVPPQPAPSGPAADVAKARAASFAKSRPSTGSSKARPSAPQASSARLSRTHLLLAVLGVLFVMAVGTMLFGGPPKERVIPFQLAPENDQ